MNSNHAFIALNSSHETLPPYRGSAALSPALDEMAKSESIGRSANTSAPYKSKPFLPPTTYKRQGFFRRHISLWRALPVALAAIFWSAQMVYFIFYFITRPAQEDGSWPRIGPSYALFPFISCVGAVREFSFESVSITVAILLWTGFGIDYIVGRQAPVAIWWRRGKLFCSSISSVFLIALSFASDDVHHKLHLIFTSFQICFMALAKTCDWNLVRAMRERTPNNRFIERVRIWKRIAVVVAMPSGIMAIIGIYSCTAKVEQGKLIFTPVCWTLVSFAAPAEWTLSWCWVIFLATVAYDNYHLDYTVRLLLNTPPPPPKRKSHGLAFWRRWSEKDPAFGVDMDDWGERQGLTNAAAPTSNERGGVSPPQIQIQRFSEGQQHQQQQQRKRGRSGSMTGSFREELDEEDIAGISHDGSVTPGWAPATMPRSVFEGSGYQQVRSSPPHTGEA
ncbi:uncharacterized protein PV07_11047 [Cladophialophora immunda]|uniref:CWH43-like N-terminal domain-containing protein n=1 Tax=Cladophialophora immunda TaxID=569365 RepID=A0A0D1Z572_9EURO|nr:uncharacterized protein PV07_11047 [Cladophialophora immunda]KIW22781.1 hypothetical protein PV07_11047 [Cladophialophora immunda]